MGEGLAVKLDESEQITLVGQCDRGHSRFGAVSHQRRYAHRAIDDRKLRMDMQVNERSGHGIVFTLASESGTAGLSV